MEGRLFTFFGMIPAENHHALIYVTHLLLAVAIIIVLARLATRAMNITPRGTQNVMEAYLGGVLSMVNDVIGEHEGRKYFPLVATIGLFVATANILGIIPGFESPSGSLNFTLALAVMVFVYYNFEGIRTNGIFAYFKHFMGPVWWLSWLMFPIEIVSHVSRIVSLSFRLFGNIKGDDLFLMVLLLLAPWFAPLPAFALLTFMALLQTYIFMMLTTVYIAGAIHVSDH
ncbi:MAG: ATP synthase F0F1 subunit A [Sulfuricurvum sp. PC08-66]|nr:MAG: ATP synthase F0F1 subunit A [Sulfuricurvum sp. PC08-66]